MAKKKQPTPAQKQEVELKFNKLHALSLIQRTNVLSQFGKQFKGDRDLNTALGWETEPSFETYNNQYKRGALAKTIVNIKPEDTWRGDITITVPEDKEGNTPADAEKFETEWAKIWRELRMKEYFLRADRMAGIGQYSVMRLGFKETGFTKDDEKERIRTEVTNATELIFVSVFSQLNADLVKVFDEPDDARFGKVEEYQLTETNELVKDISGTTIRRQVLKTGTTVNVHGSRIIHIAENLQEDEIHGIPRLECVLNNLYDLQKISGGSAEMYWRGAFPGYHFKLDPEATIDEDDLKKMTEEIDDMIMGLKRYIKTQAVESETLAPQVADPDKQFDIQIDLIAAAIRTPKRILMGNESGDLASTQDERAWARVIQSRRENDCERWLRDFTDRLIKLGILPAVDHYIINWPSLVSENAKELAETARFNTQAMTDYATKDGDQMMPPFEFLTEILGLRKDLVEQFKSMFDAINGEEGMEGNDEMDDELNTDHEPGGNGNVTEAVKKAAEEVISE